MITNIELEGFKSFVSESIDLNGLTVLTGLNSSGKSSVLQCIQLLEKAFKNESVILDGHGNLKELKNPYCEVLEIRADFSNGASLQIKNGDKLTNGEINFPELIYVSADRFGPETSIPIFTESHKLGRKGQNVFKCIEYYGDYQINEKLVHPNSEGLTFLFNLRAWMGVISPNVQFIHKIEEITDSSFGTFNGYRAKNVGFGLSYTLPVITALLMGSLTPNSIVLIENPEAHLHPKGQAEIGRLISLCAEVGVQVIIETHSDHVFDAIRVHAKQEDSFHSKVNVYWFELDNNNNTEVQQSILDKDGRLDIWPKGLFDQFQINANKLL